jgi:hypothetical protein
MGMPLVLRWAQALILPLPLRSARRAFATTWPGSSPNGRTGQNGNNVVADAKPSPEKGGRQITSRECDQF